MPECLDCHVVSSSAHLRRTSRGGVPGWICKDKSPCRNRVARAKADERARNLRPAELAMILVACSRLERLRDRIGAAWDSGELVRVRTAHAELSLFITNRKEG